MTYSIFYVNIWIYLDSKYRYRISTLKHLVSSISLGCFILLFRKNKKGGLPWVITKKMQQILQIQKRFGIFRKRGTPEMDFPKDTVVRYFIFSGIDVEPVKKEFFLIKLEKVKMPKAKKRKLLIDYFKQLLGEIDSVTMTEIERAIKDKVYCATAKCGKKYYPYEEFSIYNLPEDDDNEEDEEYDD